MKKLIITLVAAVSLMASAQDAEKPWQYVDAQQLRIINKSFPDTERTYSRLPASLKDSVRPDLWNRQECSTGIGVRFATNSTRIGVKYQLLWDFHMVHMADTGTKGTDLYTFEGDSAWRHVNTTRPYLKDKENKIVESTYVSNLDGQMHEYMIYFPLYDGIEQLSVKVDSGAIITPGSLELIRPDRRIVAYGTSIMQGGCASRTGMVMTNIFSRKLNAEVINLGFSGEAKMDSCVARAINRIPDVDMILLDPIPNCTEMMCDTLTYGFVKIIADAHPTTPIVFVAGPMYPYTRYDRELGAYLPRKNEKALANIRRLQDEGYNNIYWVDSVGLDGPEDDGTVDGIHLTDLGFVHYANHLLPLLQTLMKPE